jgi:alpha-1,6-mannosyltransferase
MKGIPLRYIILALLLEAFFLALARAALADRIVTAIVILLLSGAVYVIAVYSIQKTSPDAVTPLFMFIIASAIVFRVTVWPLTFPSTDDAYRYRWEGKLQAHGGNPYQARPSDPELAYLRDSTYPRVGLRDFKGGYGPAWEMVSALNYRVVSRLIDIDADQVFWFKIPSVLGDLALVAAVTALLRASGLPSARVLIYAWSPLPVWEFWANGHNDALVLLATVLALLWALRGQPWWAATALGVATALKFWPALLAAAFARRSLRFRHLLICIPVFLAFALPYWTGVTENVQFMSGFVGGWRNNDSLFGAILWLSGNLYRAKYMAFALIGITSAIIAVKQTDLTRAVLWTIVSLLLIASNCHPWYLTWVLPLLAVHPVAGLVLWTTLVPLFYAVWPGWIATGIWDGVTPTRWLVYVPVFSLLAGRLLYDFVSRGSRSHGVAVKTASE